MRIPVLGRNALKVIIGTKTYPVQNRDGLAVDVPDPIPGPVGPAGPQGPKGDTPNLTDLGLYVDDEGYVRQFEEEPDPDPDPEPSEDPQWAIDLRAHWDDAVITATSVVPDTIPHDGVTSASSALQAWITAQPSGASPTQLRRYDFSALRDGTVLLDGRGMDFRGKSNIIVDLTGTSWVFRGTGASNFENFIMTGNGHDLWFEGGGTCEVDGENPATGTTDAGSWVSETLTAINHRNGSQYVRVSGMNWDRLRGFGPITTGKDSVSLGPPTNIWWHDCNVRGGEMGLAWVSGRKCLAEDITLVDSAINAMDVEPDEATNVIEDILIKNITVRNFGWDQRYTPWFWSSVPGGSGESVEMHRITVEGCDISNVAPGHGSHPGRMGFTIRADDPNVKTDYVIRNNRTNHVHQDNGPMLNFRGVDKLTITGNTAPIGSGTFANTSGCTTVTVEGNDTEA